MGRALIRAVLAATPRARARGGVGAPRARLASARTRACWRASSGRASRSRASCPRGARPTSGSTSPRASVTESVATRRPRRASALVIGTTGLGTHARAAIDVAALHDPDRLRRELFGRRQRDAEADRRRRARPRPRLRHGDRRDPPPRQERRAVGDGAAAWPRRWPRRPAATWRRPPATPATATSARAARARSASRPCAAATSSATTPCSSSATATASRSPTARRTRDTFAVGAVRAALWVAGCQPGLYDMRNVLGLGL